MTVFFGIAIIAVAIVFYAINLYNVLVQQRMVVREASADIETLLKKRFDLVPNLVNTVKGYAKHEEGVFTKVTELRTQMQEASGDMAKLSEINNQMTQTLKSLFAVAENYPNLKADASFLQLQAQLADLETEIQKSRRFYNATVGDYNTKLQVFPNVLFVGIFKFTPAEFFAAADEEKQNVKVEF
ncbi:MAG: LemA family protein [Candidatus Dojkabacteria bacterium]|nr:MAG: LemA family protein [Candidatus Dojkabacteria bacterium]